MAEYVWRVENENGEGPYTGRNCIEEMCNEHSDNLNKWPSPYCERLPIYGSWLCGFASKEQARKWFLGYWRMLRERGFRLKRIRAVDVNYGVKQVTFKRAEPLQGQEREYTGQCDRIEGEFYIAS